MIDYRKLLPPPHCNSDERDIALGRFMYEWGRLEMQLLYLFHILSDTKWAIARIIFSVGFQSKNLSDILKALGQVRLNPNENATLKRLCERYNKAALKRNRIVHGLWDIELTLKHNSRPIIEWSRINYPTDPTKEKQIFNKYNQKERIKYRFTINQMNIASSNLEALANDINDFNNIIINQLYYPEQS